MDANCRGGNRRVYRQCSILGTADFGRLLDGHRTGRTDSMELLQRAEITSSGLFVVSKARRIDRGAAYQGGGPGPRAPGCPVPVYKLESGASLGDP